MTERRTIQINPQFLTPATANFVSAGAGAGTGAGAGAGAGAGSSRTRLFKTKPEGTPNHRKTQSLKQQFLARIKNKVAANVDAQSLPLDNASQDKALQDSMNLFKELADKRLERKKQKTLRRQLLRQQNDPLMHVATSLPPELAYVPRPAPVPSPAFAPAPVPAPAPAPVFRPKTKIHGNGTMLQPHVIEEPLVEEKSQEKTRVITTTAEPAVKNVGTVSAPTAHVSTALVPTAHVSAALVPTALVPTALVPTALALATAPNPPYSNLKNGTRPTYRNWVTQKNKHHGQAQQIQAQQIQGQQGQGQQGQGPQGQGQQGQQVQMQGQGQAQQVEPVSALAKFKKNYHKSRKGFLAANVLHKQKVDMEKQKVDMEKQKLANEVAANAVVANDVAANAVVANDVALANAVVANGVASANGVVANEVATNTVAFAPKGRTPKAKRFVKTLKKYKLGKHANGKVSILIKNAQTRKRVQQEHDNLKTQPILEVKNYLRGKNLLKIGSLIPDDVARELYEAAILTGDVRNQSSDTLMHNFFTKE
jgi:hypothetical protein